MSDPEARVRTRLREYGEAITPSTDIPAAGRARWRRRVRRQRAAAVLAGVVVVVAATGLGVSLARRPSGDRPLQFATNATTAPTSPATALPARVPAVGSVVSGLPLADTTWISADEGWALTNPAILHTTDGGRTWRVVMRAAPAPVVRSTDGDRYGTTDCGVDCVSDIRFADARHGWLFGGAFFETVDGGKTWTRVVSRPVVALEVAHERVYRVVTARDGCPPDCDYGVETATVGSNDWTPLSGSTVSGDAVQLLYEGPRLYVVGYGNPAGGVTARVHLVRSPDAGTTWVDAPDPCATHEAGTEIDTAGAATSPGRNLVALCEPRTTARNGPFILTSADAGATFSAPRPLPAGVTGAAVATGAPDAIVVVGIAHSGWVVEVSHDGGRSWKQTLSAPLSQGDAAVTFLGFEDAHTARVALAGDRLWTTRDGGDTWTLGRP